MPGISPKCKCHGEPSLWHPDARYKAEGFWYCRVKNREANKKWSDNLHGVAYARRLMRQRRWKAIDRRRRREREMRELPRG